MAVLTPFQGTDFMMQNKRVLTRHKSMPIPKLKVQTVDEEKSLFDKNEDGSPLDYDFSQANQNFSADPRYKLRNILTTDKPSEDKET